MKKLILSVEETKELKEQGSVEIFRNGYWLLVEQDEEIDIGYMITIINPYEKVVLKEV